MRRSTHLTLTVLTALVLAAGLWLVPAAANAEPAPAARKASAAQKYQRAAFVATNKQRVKRDRAKLKPGRCVQRYAVRWAKHMAKTHDFSHQALEPVLDRCGLNSAGENIAYGFASGTAVVNQGWMHSKGHRENILRPRFRVMGIGAARDKHGTWYVSQVFGGR